MECALCKRVLGREHYTWFQLSKNNARQCNDCNPNQKNLPSQSNSPSMAPTAAPSNVEGEATASPALPPGCRICRQCGVALPKKSFSKSQLKKERGTSTCVDCVGKSVTHAQASPSQPSETKPTSTAKAKQHAEAKSRPPPSLPPSAQPVSASKKIKKTKTHRSSNRSGGHDDDVMISDDAINDLCVLCMRPLDPSDHFADGLFGRPDGGVECKSYRWFIDNGMLSRNDVIFVCRQHRTHELPLPWGTNAAFDLADARQRVQREKVKAALDLQRELRRLPPMQRLMIQQMMLNPHGLFNDCGDDDEGFDPDEMMGGGSHGFSASQVEELLMQGVKPWDDDAGAVLAALESM